MIRLLVWWIWAKTCTNRSTELAYVCIATSERTPGCCGERWYMNRTIFAHIYHAIHCASDPRCVCTPCCWAIRSPTLPKTSLPARNRGCASRKGDCGVVHCAALLYVSQYVYKFTLVCTYRTSHCNGITNIGVLTDCACRKNGVEALQVPLRMQVTRRLLSFSRHHRPDSLFRIRIRSLCQESKPPPTSGNGGSRNGGQWSHSRHPGGDQGGGSRSGFRSNSKNQRAANGYVSLTLHKLIISIVCGRDRETKNLT